MRTLLVVCAVAPVQHRSSFRLISQLGEFSSAIFDNLMHLECNGKNCEGDRKSELKCMFGLCRQPFPAPVSA